MKCLINNKMNNKTENFHFFKMKLVLPFISQIKIIQNFFSIVN